MPTLRLDADAKAGVKAFKDLENAVGKVEDKLELTKREARQLEIQAKRIVDSNLSPQEKYNRKLEEMAKLVKAGKLELSDAQVQAAKLAKRYTEVEQAGDGAFGSGMLTKIGGMVGATVGFGTVLSTIVGGFKEIDETAKRASASVMNSLSDIGDLQLISDDPKGFKENVKVARDIVRRGITDEKGSYGIAGDISVAGLSDDERRQFLDRLERRQIKPEDASGALISGAKVGNLYAGKGLSYGEILDKLAIASGPGSSTPGEFARASTQWGQGATMLGFSGDEGLAAQMVAEKYAGSIDIAGTQMGELMTQLMKKNLAKATIQETVSNLDQLFAAGEKPLEGNALKAYSSLSRDKALLGKYQQDLARATGSFDSKYYLEEDPSAKYAKLRARAGGMLADNERQYADAQLLFDTVRDERIAYAKGQGRQWNAYFRGMSAWVDDTFTDGSMYIENALRTESHMLSPETRDAAGSYLLNNAGSQSEKNEIMQLLRTIAANTGGTERAVSGQGTQSTRQE